jgi:hypothetical protein
MSGVDAPRVDTSYGLPMRPVLSMLLLARRLPSGAEEVQSSCLRDSRPNLDLRHDPPTSLAALHVRHQVVVLGTT